ncbi:ABC-2 transporter permease [Lachnospiraceae bacterium 47-T17]
MRGLLKKDFCLLKTQRNFLLLIVVMTCFIGYNSSDGNFAVPYLTFLSSFLLLSSFNYDDNGGCISFLLTLPVSRSGYVREKYIFGMCLTTSGWVIGLLIDTGMSLVRGKQLPALGSSVAILMGFFVFISVLIPVIFRYGVDRGRIVICFVIVMIVGVFYFGDKLLAGMDVETVLSRLFAGRRAFLLACEMAVTLAVCAASYGISVQILKRKEF